MQSKLVKNNRYGPGISLILGIQDSRVLRINFVDSINSTDSRDSTGILGAGHVLLEHFLKLILPSVPHPLHIPPNVRCIPVFVHDF